MPTPRFIPSVSYPQRCPLALLMPTPCFIPSVPVDALPLHLPPACSIPPNVMGAKFDCIYWDPPAGAKHQW